MKKILKKALKITPMLIFTVFILTKPVTVHAWEAHLNENGDIEIYTVDKKGTSKIYYKTKGVDITRCMYNPSQQDIHTSGEYFSWELENKKEKENNGMIYITWTLSMEDLINGASVKDAAWGEEIKKALEGTGPAVYVKLDCIMIVYDDINNKSFGPYRNRPNDKGGKNETGIDNTGQEIQNAYAWANKSGLKTHYNHYLLIGEGVVSPAVELEDEFVTYDYTMDHYANIDANQPAYAMSNFSSLFDLSQGIPSSEYIDNAYLADSWYANTNVYARTVEKEYKWSMTYSWITDNGQYVEDTDANGIGLGTYTWVPDLVTNVSPSYELPIGNAYVAFQYLADTQAYDFTNADIANGAYEGDHVFYDDTVEIPMTCISTSEYKNIGTGIVDTIDEIDWKANTDDHVVLPQGINYVHNRSVNSANDIAQAIIDDTEAIRTQLSNATKSRNDNLTIDGYHFMKDNWVTGCDFGTAAPTSYKGCTHSSAWVNDYMLQSNIRPLHEYDPRDVTGTKSVQIPSTVDNGYYYTSMDVYYQKLVPYIKSASTFSNGK